MPTIPLFSKPLDMDNYARVLATMTEPALLAEIKQNALDLDFPRMQASIDAGAFSAQPFIDHGQSSAEAMRMAQEAWKGRCDAMLSVMDLAGYAKEENEFGVLKIESHLNPEQKSVMGEFLGKMAQETQVWQKALESSYIGPVVKAVSKAMHMACTMDDAHSLDRLIAVCPHGVHWDLDVELIGKGIMGKHRDGEFHGGSEAGMEASTLFTALQFSSARCVPALLAAADEDAMLYAIEMMDGTTHRSDFLSSFRHVVHHGDAATLMPMMKDIASKLNSSNGVERMKAESIVMGSHDVVEKYGNDEGHLPMNRHLAPLFAKAGWMGLNAQAWLTQGIVNNEETVLAHFEPNMPWPLISTLWNVEEGKDSPFLSSAQMGTLQGWGKIANMAMAQGQEAKQAVLANFIDEGVVREDFLDAILNNSKSTSILPALLKLGLDTTAKVVTNKISITLAQAFQESDTDAGHILASFQARSKAHALISEMEAVPKSGPFPG